MNNINTLSKQSSQISRAPGVWGSGETGKQLKTSATPITAPHGDEVFSIGVPETQKSRVEDLLRSGLSDGPKPYSNLKTRGESAISIKYTIEPSSEGFFNIFFHEMDRETFYRIVQRLKIQGINTIGADSELSEEDVHNLSGLEDSSDSPIDQVGFKGVNEDTIELDKKSMNKLHKTGKMSKGDHTIKFIEEFIQKEVKRLKESVNEPVPELDKIRKDVEAIAKKSLGKGWTKNRIDQEVSRRWQRFLNRESVNEASGEEAWYYAIADEGLKILRSKDKKWKDYVLAGMGPGNKKNFMDMKLMHKSSRGSEPEFKVHFNPKTYKVTKLEIGSLYREPVNEALKSGSVEVNFYLNQGHKITHKVKFRTLKDLMDGINEYAIEISENMGEIKNIGINGANKLGISDNQIKALGIAFKNFKKKGHYFANESVNEAIKIGKTYKVIKDTWTAHAIQGGEEGIKVFKDDKVKVVDIDTRTIGFEDKYGQLLSLNKDSFMKIVKESVNEEQEEFNKPIIVMYNKKRYAVEPEDLERLKLGKDVVGKSAVYQGQEEWILAKSNWKIEGAINEFIQKEVKALIKKKAKPLKEGAIRQWVIEEGDDIVLKIPHSTEMSQMNKRDFEAFLNQNEINFDPITDDEMDEYSHYLIFTDISPEMLKDLQDTYHASL